MDDMTQMDDDDGQVSKAPDQSKFDTLKEWITADLDHSAKWRTRAKKEFEFVAGPGQWSEEDKSHLMSEERPMLTFNKTLKFIRAICGIEANNRHETTFMPLELDSPGEVKANEVLSAGSSWMGKSCNAERKQSRAFRDEVICGMGWTEAGLDFDTDPKGMYSEVRCDPLTMGWDRNAREQNLEDAKRVFQVKKMLLSEARALIPGVTDSPSISNEDLDAFWASGAFDYRAGEEAKTQQQKELREENTIKNDPRTEVHIVRIQWWEYETYTYGFNPMTGKNEAMAHEEFEALQEQMAVTGVKLPGTKMRRKKYMQAFLGNRVLEISECPCPSDFTFQCMTWEPDDIDGTWYGIVRVLIDPQTWLNKWISQVMHMVNTTAKGGVIIESDAVSDVREFQQTYAKANAASVVNPGTISKGKIMAKPGAALTAGVLNLLEIANVAFQDVTGMNLELMGLADRDQPGVLEAQRKQAAMTILATLFDSLSLFRVRNGRVRLHYLQTTFADGRLIRVAGPDAQMAIPLIKDQLAGRYDVDVEDAPTSPNTKEKTWGTIQMLLPPLLKANMVPPKMIIKLLDYVPFLPSKLVQAFKQIAEEPDPQGEKQAALAQRGAEAEVAETEASADLKTKQAAAAHASAILDLANAGAAEAQQQATRFDMLLATLGIGGKKPPLAQDEPPQANANALPQLPMLGQAPQQALPLPDVNAAPAQPPGIALPGGLNGGR